MSLFLTCDQAVERLTDYQEGALPWFMALRMRVHIMLCKACQALHQGLHDLPFLAKEADISSTGADLAPVAHQALREALARVGQPRPHRQRPIHPVPEAVKPLLTSVRDRTLSLFAEVHAAFQTNPILEAPYLPAAVLAQLPPAPQWRWQKVGAARQAILATDPTTGARLKLLVAPAGFRAHAHTHMGSENMLILNGYMEDGEQMYTDGTWAHFGEGSSHAPTILGGDCWCLIREVGDVRFNGPLGWFRSLVA